MKDAYSNLLGEYVEAEEVDADDIIGFQIVCPCCRDAIFKVAREQAQTQFFSHYRASPDYPIEECERRVASISREDRESTNSTSRRMLIEMFRAVIRDAVSDLPIRGKAPSGKALPQGSLLNVLAGYIHDRISDMSASNLANFMKENNEVVSGTKYDGGESFSDKVRTRIVLDVLRSLFTSHATRTLNLLMGRAFYATHEKVSDNSLVTSYRATMLHQHYWRDEMGEETEDGGWDGTTMVYGVMDALLRELYRLPYFRMIENHRNGLSPLSGITLDDYLPDAVADEEAAPSPFMP